MGYFKRRITCVAALVVGLAVAWGAHAAPSSSVVVSIAGGAAAWQPAAGRLNVVSTRPVAVSPLPAGWQSVAAESGGLHTVQMSMPHGVSWGVESTAAGIQMVAQGTAKARGVAARLLADGATMEGRPVTPVQTKLGAEVWEAVLVNNKTRSGKALVGAVRRLKTADAAQTTRLPALSKNSPADATANLPVAFFAALEPASGLAAIPTPTVRAEALEDVQSPWPEAWQTMGMRPLGPITNPYTMGQAFVVNLPPVVAQPAVQAGGSARAVSSSQISNRKQPPRAQLQGPAPSEHAPTELPETLIPQAVGSYAEGLSEQMRALVETTPGSMAEREVKSDLAGFYMAWQRPEEAAAVLATMPQRADGLPAGAWPRMLYGLTQLAQHKPVRPEVFDQGGVLATHARLWKAVAYAQAEEYSAAIKAWPRQSNGQTNLLEGYPGGLRQLAHQAQLASLVFTGQMQLANTVYNNQASSYSSSSIPAVLLRLGGLARIGTPEEPEGLEMLAAAAESKTDPGTATRAKYEFVKILNERREISNPQTIAYLEDLRMDWRGDSTEREILLTLADLYEKTGDPRNALERWRTVANSFRNVPEINLITKRMAAAFTNVFDPENPHPLDPLSYLGLYYDFRELLPADESGDRVQEYIAEVLNTSTLWERAIPLLEQQLQYRPLEGVTQGRLALLLANLYRQRGQPEESVKVLEKWQSVATTQVLQRAWKLAQARNELALNRPSQALEALKQMNLGADREAARLAMEAHWQAQQWREVAQGLEGLLGKVPTTVLVSSTEAQLDVFKLGYAYGQLKDAKNLAALKRRYAEAWPKLPKLADNLNAVAASSGVEGVPPEGGAMEALTTALSQINALNDQIQATRRTIRQGQETREEYNKRMRYMELLPPPAL